jgi:D-3-phosphoglycerate dehydrogenase
MFKILTLNNISIAGLERLPRDRYEIASEIQHPDAILLRSYKMHDMEIPTTLKAVGRAGAGVNNIPVEKLSTLGVPVFNAPGANANAVKELVLAGMLLASRNICQAWDFSRRLDGSDEEINKRVEAGKKKIRWLRVARSYTGGCWSGCHWPAGGQYRGIVGHASHWL